MQIYDVMIDCSPRSQMPFFQRFQLRPYSMIGHQAIIMRGVVSR